MNATVRSRARTAPRRLADGLKRLLGKARMPSVAICAGCLWWAWEWAQRAGESPVRMVALPTTAALLLAAYTLGSEPKTPTAPPPPQEPGLAQHAPLPDAPEEADEADEADELPAPSRDELIAALHHLADRHIHLIPLAQHLGLKDDTAHLRTLLKQARIPITDGVRMQGRGVSPGVKATDLPPLPSPETTPAPDVVAPVTSNNNSNNAPIVERREGMTIIRDPADFQRRHHTMRKP